jgi:HAMP domain-containing protein
MTASASALSQSTSSRHSRRLQELRDAAENIRRRHAEGKISAEQAAHELDALSKKNSSLLDRILFT